MCCGPPIGIYPDVRRVITTGLTSPRCAIGSAEVNQVEVGVVGKIQPSRAAAGLPRVTLPGFVTLLAGTGDGVETPDQFARRLVIGLNRATYAIFATRVTNDHFVPNGDGRNSYRVTVLIGTHLSLPQLLTGFRV